MELAHIGHGESQRHLEILPVQRHMGAVPGQQHIGLALMYFPQNGHRLRRRADEVVLVGAPVQRFQQQLEPAVHGLFRHGAHHLGQSRAAS